MGEEFTTASVPNPAGRKSTHKVKTELSIDEAKHFLEVCHDMSVCARYAQLYMQSPDPALPVPPC